MVKLNKPNPQLKAMISNIFIFPNCLPLTPCAHFAYISKGAVGRIFQLQSLSCARRERFEVRFYRTRTQAAGDGVLSLIRSDSAHKKSRMLIKFDARLEI
jgi:hypothetical protein